MDYENDRILKLIFPQGVPDNLQDNPELFTYLEKLGSYKIDQLKKEEVRLEDENKSIVEQTQDLAITNYKTIIQTSETSRSIFKEFLITEKRVDSLIEKLPTFTDKCQKFLDTTTEINSSRRLNLITFKKTPQLLDVLELPQLMETCIQNGQYEGALELASYVQKLGQKHGKIGVIQTVVASIESAWHTMLVQLLEQLRTDLQLPKCLQVVGYLRRMQAFGNSELKLKFLQARDAWLTNLLNSIPKDDAQQHLTKTIELIRINVFNIITHYKAIFPDDDNSIQKTTALTSDGGRIFHAWLHKKIDDFLVILEEDLQNVNSLDTVLGQCMYFGLSFSRVGADFRALMAPIFVRVISQNFIKQIIKVNRQFDYDMEKFTLINKLTTTMYSNRKNQDFEQQIAQQQYDSYSPPESLLDFPPLAILCNGYLTILNDIRLCAPISIVDDLTKTIQSSLELVGKKMLTFYKQEQTAFVNNDRDIFIKFCVCFAYDLLPYLQRCIHAIYPEQILTNHLGISIMALQKDGISFLQPKIILEPIKHLLPDKMNLIMMQDQQQQKQLKEDVQKEIVMENS